MRPQINNTWQRLRYALLGLLFLVSTFAVIYSSGTRVGDELLICPPEEVRGLWT